MQRYFRLSKCDFFSKNIEKICVFQKKAVPLHANLEKCGGMSEKKNHIVQLDTLDVGEHLFDFQLDNSYFSDIEHSELLGGEVDVKVRLILHEDSLSLDLDIVGQVQVTCDRCLDSMDVDVDIYEEDVDVEDDAQTIDLSWLAYELIIVNLPLVHSHQEGGCNPQMDALLQNHLCTELNDANDIQEE